MGDRADVGGELPGRAGPGIANPGIANPGIPNLTIPNLETPGRDNPGHAAPCPAAPAADTSRVPPAQFVWSRRRLIILGTLLLGLLFGLAGLLITTQRAASISDRLLAMTNLAQVLAEQTSRTLQPVDLTLREMVDRLTTGGSRNQENAGDWTSMTTFDLLVDRLRGLPQVDALILVGADGHVRNFSRGFPAADLDVSDRDYYRYFSTRDDRTIFVSIPAKAFLSDRWLVFLSRRVNDAHGAFAGIVVAAVTLSYLEDFYQAVTAENGAVTVMRRDGVILVHFPHAERDIGVKPTAAAHWVEALQQGGGSYRSPEDLDGKPRLVAVRPLREFPLVIDVSTSESSALSGWHRQAVWLLTGAVSAAACVILLLRAFGGQYGRLVAQNAQLESGRLRLDAVLDNMSQGLTLFDADRKLLVSNRRFAEIYRLSADQTRPGTPLLDIVRHRQDRGTLPMMTQAEFLGRTKQLVGTSKPFELANELPDGRTIFLQSRPLPGGGWVSTHEDITDRRRAEASLAFMARHDALTELPNRTLFQERLAEAIGMARLGTWCALMCLDLDRFKVINDTLGHPVGDGLLRAVAGRLSAAVREVDTVARLGGDEFAIIQVGVGSSEEAEHLAGRIIGAMCQHFDIDGHRIVAGTSIGIALAPRDGTSAGILQKNADVALYLAKTEGRGTYRFFEPEMDALVLARREVELDLRNALPAEAFDLHYQPVLDLQSGNVIAFESLIRWNHPLRGLISPADFIPTAEEFGLIVPIGEWVLRQACIEAAAWPRDIGIGVNLSPVQFKGGQLLDGVRKALTASTLDPRRLVLEITESVLLQNSEETLTVLHQLRALGIRIALDDFGTGYSSLSYLRSFPFDIIKIDRSFIRDLDRTDDSAVIVGAIVDIARGLGMTTVAEGVETTGQLEKVRDQGCTKVQGYLFSRPRPAGEVPALIRTLRVPMRNGPGRDTGIDAADPNPNDAPCFPDSMVEWSDHYGSDAFNTLAS